MKKILMIVDYEGKFRGGLPTTSSLNISKIITYFKEAGFEVETKKFNDVANNLFKEFPGYIIYTSVENTSYKMYLDDILFTLYSNGKNLIPRYELFRAHDNKAYQEILKQLCHIDSNPGKIYRKWDEIEADIKSFHYPLIIKNVSGSVGKAVFKIENELMLEQIYDGFIFQHKSQSFNTKRKIKKKLNYKYDKIWYDRENQKSYVIIQTFIPNLDGDWKILVFGDKYFVLKRGIRSGDFRASGSGILDFEIDPPEELLNFAEDIFHKLDTPFISLDIAMSDSNMCHLIEYQALHFGPLTLTASKKYYTNLNGSWEKVVTDSELEKNYVDAYLSYIKKRKL